MNNRLKGNLLLLLTAAIWGSALVAQKTGMDHVGPLTFTAARFMCGGLVLLPVIYIMDKKRKACDDAALENDVALGDDSALKGGSYLLKAGIICGLIILSISILQQVGIQYVSVGKTGFITCLYILIVPLLGLLRKQRPGRQVWLSIGVALIGLYLLCVKDGFSSIAFGDLLILIASFFCALHIVVVDFFVCKVDGVKLACIQFFTTGIISGILAPIFEEIQISTLLSAAIPILYAGVISCGGAYTFQIIAQKMTGPVITSLILSLESVFSALAGFLFLGELMSGKEYIGCVLMFSAIILAQLPAKKKAGI